MSWQFPPRRCPGPVEIKSDNAALSAAPPKAVIHLGEMSTMEIVGLMRACVDMLLTRELSATRNEGDRQ